MFKNLGQKYEYSIWSFFICIIHNSENVSFPCWFLTLNLKLLFSLCSHKALTPILQTSNYPEKVTVVLMILELWRTPLRKIFQMRADLIILVSSPPSPPPSYFNHCLSTSLYILYIYLYDLILTKILRLKSLPSKILTHSSPKLLFVTLKV